MLGSASGTAFAHRHNARYGHADTTPLGRCAVDLGQNLLGFRVMLGFIDKARRRSRALLLL